LGVIGVDSSGIIKDPPEPVWMAAVRKVQVQKHNILYLSESECAKYRKMIPEEWWRERIGDIIQIHEDWKGKRRRKIVERYLRRMFGIRFLGRHPLNNPKIQFISGEGTLDIQLADRKSWKARHGWKDCVFNCPDLSKLLEDLDKV
jgi:hypothetical protein